ncbi:MAG: hypothetical protein V1678_04100 [Candidatus Aenigmatarchaeota archaeon]
MANPVFALSPMESLISNLRAAGFQLVLLWLLTLAVVYGILSHMELPKSITTRGVISIVSAFMVLIAAAGSAAAEFISSIVTSSILVAFGLIMTMIFIEIVGAKSGGEHIFAKHPKFFASALIIIFIMIFIGAGGLGLLNISFPIFALTDPLIAIVFFLLIMVATIWILVKEGDKK